MKRLFSGLVFFILTHFGSLSQERPQILVNLAKNEWQSGQIELVQPQQIDRMLMMQISNNRQQKGIPGYRIRIFSQSGLTAKQRADDTRASFTRLFPEMEAYQEYNTPNFQIFVGDFRTKTDALRETKRIERIYPGAFIVTAIVDISK